MKQTEPTIYSVWLFSSQSLIAANCLGEIAQQKESRPTQLTAGQSPPSALLLPPPTGTFSLLQLKRNQLRQTVAGEFAGHLHNILVATTFYTCIIPGLCPLQLPLPRLKSLLGLLLQLCSQETLIS